MEHYDPVEDKRAEDFWLRLTAERIGAVKVFFLEFGDRVLDDRDWKLILAMSEEIKATGQCKSYSKIDVQELQRKSKEREKRKDVSRLEIRGKVYDAFLKSKLNTRGLTSIVDYESRQLALNEQEQELVENLIDEWIETGSIPESPESS